MRLPKFYPILDSELCARSGITMLGAAETLLAGGTKILQARHKGFFSRAMFLEFEHLANLCAQHNAIFVVNDRADLARLFGAALHLGQDDLPPREARRVTGEALTIGFSTHNEGQLRAAADEPVNYLALGPIFGTASKENPDPVVGVAELRRLRPLSPLPLVAIGGITRAAAREVLAAGADSIAVISDVMCDAGALGARTEEWLRVTE
jgi:thiamine-phosphate pyrophosphorylase